MEQPLYFCVLSGPLGIGRWSNHVSTPTCIFSLKVVVHNIQVNFLANYCVAFVLCPDEDLTIIDNMHPSCDARFIKETS
jgi:hypothetical protein